MGTISWRGGWLLLEHAQKNHMMHSKQCLGGTIRETPGEKTEAFYLKYILFPGLFLDLILSSCGKHLDSIYKTYLSVGGQNIALEPRLVSVT